MELFSKWETSGAGRAGAEGGGFPALASSLGLVWELDFGTRTHLENQRGRLGLVV